MGTEQNEARPVLYQLLSVAIASSAGTSGALCCDGSEHIRCHRWHDVNQYIKGDVPRTTHRFVAIVGEQKQDRK